MRDAMIRVPEGMRDLLSCECAERRAQCAGLSELFGGRGFLEVSTPILERYELFTRTGSPISEESMVKVIGRDGRICVLRPDNTAPIARLAATRLQNETLPLKLWYTQPVFRSHEGGCEEVFQSGAEIIGDANDAEVILLAKEAAALIYSKAPHIEVSHAGILQALFAHMNLSPTQTRTALSLIRRKNFAALGELFSPSALKLMRLSGGSEALDEAAALSPGVMDAPLAELRALFAGLPSGAVTVDFGLALAPGYYTGIFFRGYVDGAADAVLSGGRYDHLLGLLGRNAPASGFAIRLGA